MASRTDVFQSPDYYLVDELLTEEQKAQKQQEIWDAFREAHYEGKSQIDQ